SFANVNGAVFWTARQGAGLPLVLCHGGPGMWDYLGGMADMVEDLVTVHRYDQRGCGRSSGGSSYSLLDAVADLDALRLHVGAGWWIGGGHLLGASLALAFCLEHPDRAVALLYLSGTGIAPGWHAAYRSNRAARLGPAGQRRFEALREQLGQLQGEELAAV